MGLVAYQGKWERPDEVSREVQDDPERKARIQEYLQRRAKAPETGRGPLEAGSLVRAERPQRAGDRPFSPGLAAGSQTGAAWKHLGFKRVGGHWVKPERVAAAKVAAAAAEQGEQALEADPGAICGPALQSKDASRRAEAEKALAQITDRRAVPMVWATFGRGDASLQKVAVQVLGQIDDASASRRW